MTKSQQSKVPMRAVNVSSNPDASQAAHSATDDASGSPPPIAIGSDREVVPRARRRTFSNGDKRRILQAADLCTRPGKVGALMRRESRYSSSPSTWRRKREAAGLAAFAPQKRGPKAEPARIDALQIAQLTRERGNLRAKLGEALLVIEVQERSYRAAGFAGDPRRGREHLIAAVRELTPALDAAFQARELLIYSGTPRYSAMP